MKTDKTFDCVEMQDRAALAIYEITKDMTHEEQVAYWAERDRVFSAKMEARRRELEAAAQAPGAS